MSFDSFLRKAGDAIKDIKDRFVEEDEHSHSHDTECQHPNTDHRFQSAFEQSSGDVKWYVDGASYFWAVSMALEEARESIYILDWWLSPELYLRRPPARNEKYRLDNMLKAAAERGVQVCVIVYKEVTLALSCDSRHTKHALEALHPNIKVFRHPDHVPNRKELANSFAGMSLNPISLAKASTDALTSLYGSVGDSVLFWAHHEKLCIVDRRLCFMGGLDMCHPIADAHPGNLDAIVFPGQDFNNARVFDFEGVNNWNHNQLDRTKGSRMGWSDISISMKGPIVNSLLEHFSDRWNFIFDEKYTAKDPGKYERVELRQSGSRGHHHHTLDDMSERFQRGFRRVMGEDEYEDREGGYGGGYDRPRAASIQLCRRRVSIWPASFFITATSDEQRPVQNRIGSAIVSRILRAHENGENFHIIVVMPAVPAFPGDLKSDDALGTRAIMEFQYNSICRGGHSIIESLQQAGVRDWARYIHFYNLRNYDRINASSTMREAEREAGVSYEQARRDYDNRHGEIREGYGGRTYEERGDGDRGYRGGYREERREYDDPGRYNEYGQLRRDYDEDDRRDRYGYSEGRSDEQYGRPRRDYDDSYGGGYDGGREIYSGRDKYGGRDDYGGRREDYGGRREDYGRRHEGRYERYGGDREEAYGQGRSDRPYERYQSAAAKVENRTWDTVSSCYMGGGTDIREVPWHGSEEDEMNAFVSEELYVHSKVLIADDRIVICGSANINDRSQLGNHDSEIAVIIEDPEPVETTMGGRPFTASKFAASLRRSLYRKHIGLIPDQRCDRPTRGWTPVSVDPQDYDWGSSGDRLVADPMTQEFWDLWLATARTNTQVFDKVFHAVPSDQVRNWEQYDDFFGRRFVIPGVKYKEGETEGRVEYGHVVRDEFPGGVREVKEWLSRVRGTLVEMPLHFLEELGQDLAMEGVGLNFATEEIYT
ncbi:hypothetical protein DL766_008963 [Monosporascus sp. MC13-8B]|uniref:phospholipase D n=1 Tax=Monosporascus cannonballus TaxID=155416 RepID=A0ABY0GT47_9PEZI|nr:hypothetical protein DL762_009508 [Monosporascus cannonballus]RYO80844.1 hypothetical protein DL763_008777 [Monosporascus cannonballus]RYP17178.1 hypothetical protein DL766_008963 [Monosporascus sp. MC13-8B]